MTRIAALLIAFALLPLTAAAQSYSASLSGAQEVPGPGDADGVGVAVVTIDGNNIRYSVLHQGIGAPTAAHIHTGAAGVAGPVLVPLDHNSLLSGVVSNVAAEVISQIKANPAGFYVNVHNAEFTGGAIRGQLVEVSSGSGTQTSYIPVIGKVRGNNDTNFVTDLRIVNTGSTAANVTLDFFAQAAGGSAAPTATRTITVAPGEQKVLDDVLATPFALDGVLGGLRITSTTNVIASARIINDLRGSSLGTAGFAFDAQESAPTSGTITFLTNNADFRTTIGYLNPRSTPSTVTLVARSAATGGVLGTATVAVPGHAMLQQAAFGLFSSVPESQRTQDDFYVTWSATAPLFVYASVTDNVTGDAVLNQ